MKRRKFKSEKIEVRKEFADGTKDAPQEFLRKVGGEAN